MQCSFSRLVFPMLIRILSVWLMIIYLRISIFPPKTRITWCQCNFRSFTIIEYYMICCVVLFCQFYQYNWANSMCVTIKHPFFLIGNNVQWSAPAFLSLLKCEINEIQCHVMVTHSFWWIFFCRYIYINYELWALLVTRSRSFKNESII